jgi:hypothetical protein
MAMRTTIEIPDQAHARLKHLAARAGVSLGTLLLGFCDQALGVKSDPQTGLIKCKVTGFLKLKVGRPVTAVGLKSLDQ